MTHLSQEFDRQVDNLVSKGYHTIVGIGPGEFQKNLKALKKKIGQLSPRAIDPEKGSLPFVIVIHSDGVEVEKAMSLLEREGRSGFTEMFPLPRRPTRTRDLDHPREKSTSRLVLGREPTLMVRISLLWLQSGSLV